MDLVKNTQPEVTSLVGETKIILSGGERIQIRTGSAGDITTVLDEQVPQGKYWIGGIRVAVQEGNE